MHKKCQYIVNYKRDIISIYRMNIPYMIPFDTLRIISIYLYNNPAYHEIHIQNQNENSDSDLIPKMKIEMLI